MLSQGLARLAWWATEQIMELRASHGQAGAIVEVRLVETVRERERQIWLDELTKLCEKRFQDDYRTLGVAGFYRTKLKARKDMAREVRSRIEHDRHCCRCI